MNGEPKYQTIARVLRQEIASGSLPPGAALPTETALAGDHQVARMTARQALELLESEGLIEGERPRRVVLREPLLVSLTRAAESLSPGESPTRGADAFLAEARAAGREPEQEILVIIAQASPEVAGRLMLPAGSPVIARQNVRSAGGTRHNMVTYWFPDDIARGTPLAEPGSIKEGSLAWLEAKFGTLAHRPVEISTRMPTPEEATVLGIPQGVPVAVVSRTTTMQGGLPVVTSVSLWPGDRAVLRIEI